MRRVDRVPLCENNGTPLIPPVELLSVTPFTRVVSGDSFPLADALHITIRLIEKITGADVNEQW